MPTVSGNSSASLCAGRKADAEAKLTELLSAVAKGEFVKPSKLTVAEWVSQRVEAWVEAKEISGKTEEGYRRVVDHYIVPHLGNRTLQSLKPFDVDRWRTALRTMGLSARTIGGAHRVLGKALREAVKFDVVVKNVCSSPAGGQRAPSVRDEEEMAILTEPQIAAPVDALRNCHERRGHRGRPFQLGRTLFPKFIVALFTGLRRGELLALRWGDTPMPG
ncbi:MAG TPA: hypothetical protein VFO36_06045, partial [Nitrospiraceae bacterium]|nr:hypothetical protein [Nitrospiraceae bacterium]